MAISKEKRRLMVNQWKRGKSLAAIARDNEVSRRSVVNVINLFKITGSINIHKIPGRPRSLSNRDERHLIRKVISSPFLSAQSLAQEVSMEWGREITTKIVRDALHRNGFHARKPLKKPLLKVAHRQRRLTFAKDHIGQTQDFWKRIIFSDETPFTIFPTKCGQWTWRRPHEEFQPGHIIPTVKHGGGSIQIWACMSYHGIGFMTKLNQGLDSNLYIEILEDEFLKSKKMFFGKSNDFLFQHDGASVHTAHSVSRWFENKKIKVLNWPAQSPDLNPIENLWADLKKRIMKKGNDITTKDALWDAIQEEWESTDPAFCQNLIESMPRRLEEVIQHKGGPTHY